MTGRSVGKFIRERFLIDLSCSLIGSLKATDVCGFPRVLSLGAVAEQRAVAGSSFSEVGVGGCCCLMVEAVKMFEMSSGITV